MTGLDVLFLGSPQKDKVGKQEEEAGQPGCTEQGAVCQGSENITGKKPVWLERVVQTGIAVCPKCWRPIKLF